MAKGIGELQMEEFKHSLLDGFWKGCDHKQKKRKRIFWECEKLEHRTYLFTGYVFTEYWWSDFSTKCFMYELPSVPMSLFSDSGDEHYPEN